MQLLECYMYKPSQPHSLLHGEQVPRNDLAEDGNAVHDIEVISEVA